MNRVYPRLYDEAFLRQTYEFAGMSCREVADMMGCSHNAVELALHRFDIPRRGRWYGRWNPKTCERCGNLYTPSGPAQRFCPTDACRFGTGMCPGCGNIRPLNQWQASKKGQGYCSQRCWIRKVQTPKRVEPYLRPDGYVQVYVGPRYPGVHSDGRILLHRKVVQEAIGRPLTARETVHHINGDKTDNRLENLQLRQGRHGKGVVLQCLDCGSHNVEAVVIAEPA